MHHGKFYVKDHMIEYSFKSLNFMTVLENNFLNFIAQVLGKSAVAEFKFWKLSLILVKSLIFTAYL